MPFKNLRNYAVTAAVLVAVLLTLLLSYPVGANVSYASSPPTLGVDNAVAGQEYPERLHAKYTDTTDNGSPFHVNLSASEEISDWVTFWNPSDNTTPVERLDLTNGQWSEIFVKFAIPRDAELGTVTGTIYFDFESAEGGEAVTYQGVTEVTIDITDRVQGEGLSSSLRWWIVALVGVAVVVVGAVTFFILRKRKSQTSTEPHDRSRVPKSKTR